MDIFSSVAAKALKNTLESIIDDKTDGAQADAEKELGYFKQSSMSDAYEDDQEYGGPGLATETGEGAEFTMGDIHEGATTRYIARKFGLRMRATEEALEDTKYDKVINCAGRLKRAMWKTVKVDAGNMWNRSFDTNYIGGDQLPLFSASHTLPSGGTFSNLMATPMSPSRAAVIVAYNAIALFPGHDGIVDSYQMTGIVCPFNQWATWEGILGSPKVPESNFNELNVVNTKMKLELYPLRFWNASDTNWAALSDAPDSFKWKWRRKPKSKTWVGNERETMNYSISARWARGWSDARAAYGVQA